MPYRNNMKYIHIKNLEKYHPGYKDRTLQWAKIYFKMVQGDPDCEMIEDETDWGRLIKFIILELQAQRAIPLDNKYLTKKGFNLEKRPISLTIQMLHNFISIVDVATQLKNPLHVDKDKDKEEDKEKEKYIKYVFLSKNEYQSLTDKFGKKNTDTYIESLNDYIGSKGKKYKSHYHTLRTWMRRDKIYKPREEKKELGKNRPDYSPEGLKRINKLVKEVTNKHKPQPYLKA